jgi:hypothetical protein
MWDAKQVPAFRSMSLAHDGEAIVLACKTSVRRIALAPATEAHQAAAVTISEAQAKVC